MSITRREFERQNSAELLPSSMQTYALGDIWDWEYEFLLFHPHLVYKADNIANITDVEGLYVELQNQSLVNAMIPDIDFTADIRVGASIKIPTIKNFDLTSHISNNSIVQFSFGKVKGKSMTPVRSKVSKGLDHLKETNFSRYKHAIRSYEIVIGLFYSDSVVLTVDKTISDTATLKAEFIAQGIDFDVTIDASSKETITINTSESPFAAQFISGREI